MKAIIAYSWRNEKPTNRDNQTRKEERKTAAGSGKTPNRLARDSDNIIISNQQENLGLLATFLNKW